jgi:hypothetical protein
VSTMPAASSCSAARRRIALISACVITFLPPRANSAFSDR